MTILNVKPGDLVSKGELLAAIDDTDFQLAVDDARAGYDLAQNQFSRAERLVKSGSIAKSQYDELRAQRDIAKADFDLARLRKSFTQLVAPFDGIISRVPVDNFEQVGVGQPVMNIHKTSDVDIKIQAADILYVAHSQRGFAEVTQKVDPRVTFGDGKEYRLTLKEYTVEPDPDSGAFLVTLTMPMPADRMILDGMTVEVNASGEGLRTYDANAIEIPLEAIFNGDGDSLDADNMYVWIVDEQSRVTKRHVLLERLTPTGIRIRAGVNTGESIVVSGVSRLTEGQEVTVLKGEGDQV